MSRTKIYYVLTSMLSTSLLGPAESLKRHSNCSHFYKRENEAQGSSLTCPSHTAQKRHLSPHRGVQSQALTHTAKLSCLLPTLILASRPQPTRPSLSGVPHPQSAHILILGAELELLSLLSLSLATEQG